VVDNEGPRVAVLVQDVTAQREAEDALATAQADLAQVSRVTTMGELVASIAHEVNQPLSAIVTNSHAAIRWMEREQPDYQEVVAALSRVHRDAVHAAGVIARIRNFLKKRSHKHVTVDLRGMVDCLVQMLHRRLTEAKVGIRIDIPANLPLFVADQVQLQQVLLNLMVNSIDALVAQRREDAEIALTVCERGHKDILFTVSDNGPGIPPEKQPLVFEAFFSSKNDGLGMGLAISKTIVESHGGSLWLASSNPSGTCFAFTIPLENR
jgi:C4-dicarboxylate-specific signal transduction histidine kinase